jgi:hypothetical protein
MSRSQEAISVTVATRLADGDSIAQLANCLPFLQIPFLKARIICPWDIVRNVNACILDGKAVADVGSMLFQTVMVKGARPVSPPSFSHRWTINQSD